MPTRRRINAVAAALISLSVASACSDDSPNNEPISTPTAATAEDEAIDVVETYWAERIRVETSGDYASANFDGLIDGGFAEPLIANYSTLDSGNFRRVGEPDLSDYKATVSGDSAVVTLCVNEDEWGAEADAGTVQQPDIGTYVDSYELERTDDAWTIVDQLTEPPAGVTC